MASRRPVRPLPLSATPRPILDDTQLEELYTRTFDLNPVCTPEVGWHIYGEQYRRGRFLVQARELLKIVGVDERGELPDHLMSLLPAGGPTGTGRLGPACRNVPRSRGRQDVE